MRKIFGRRPESASLLLDSSISELNTPVRRTRSRQLATTVAKGIVRTAPYVVSVAEMVADVLANLGFGEIAWALRIGSWVLRLLTSTFAATALRAGLRGVRALAALAVRLTRCGTRAVGRFARTAHRGGQRRARRIRALTQRERTALRRYRSRKQVG
ncbi:hypothetical protein ACGFQG_32140 [Nocardia fluminea]|uniref:hypothetical protein n=1 Tax=Nocardia fluminea TaxID=134984 RepID=UPI003722D60D